MQLIVVNSQKGGSGKTTLCANLSVEAERVGDGPVYLIDTDPQGSLTKWHSVRKAEAPQRIEIPFDQIAKGLEVLREGNAAYCIIDTAPDRTEDTAALLKLADLVLVPIRPSPYDLWAAAATVDLLKREGIPFLFVLNQVKANTSITAQAAAALSHHGPVVEVFVNDRVPYAAAMMDGRTATELNAKGRAAEETAALWQGIKSCLHGSMKKRKHEEVRKVLAHA